MFIKIEPQRNQRRLRRRMHGSLVRALRTKVSIARACVEKRSHLVLVAPVLIVRVTNRASSQ